MFKEQLELSGIKNIIFDLGKVIINLDIEATDRAFRDLFEGKYEDAMVQLKNEAFFESYETGKINTEDFINRLGHIIGGEAIDQKISMAWNAMLQDIPDTRFEILNWAKKRYRTFCLSNTNELHIDFIHDYLIKEKKESNLEPYFEKVYLSHEIGLRKPNEEIFEYVLKNHKLDASETLFIDDTLMHLEGARKVGLKTLHMTDDTSLEKLFEPYIAKE